VNFLSVDSLADAIENIITNDVHRMLLSKANYKAACSLPMSTITKMYIDYFKAIQVTKSTKELIDINAVNTGTKKITQDL